MHDLLRLNRSPLAERAGPHKLGACSNCPAVDWDCRHRRPDPPWCFPPDPELEADEISSRSSRPCARQPSRADRSNWSPRSPNSSAPADVPDPWWSTAPDGSRHAAAILGRCPDRGGRRRCARAAPRASPNELRAKSARCTQAGVVFAAIATRILGQFDPFAGSRRDCCWWPPTSSSAWSVKLGVLIPSDFRLWVCLHEETHRFQFGARSVAARAPAPAWSPKLLADDELAFGWNSDETSARPRRVDRLAAAARSLRPGDRGDVAAGGLRRRDDGSRR